MTDQYEESKRIAMDPKLDFTTEERKLIATYDAKTDVDYFEEATGDKRDEKQLTNDYEKYFDIVVKLDGTGLLAESIEELAAKHEKLFQTWRKNPTNPKTLQKIEEIKLQQKQQWLEIKANNLVSLETVMFQCKYISARKLMFRIEHADKNDVVVLLCKGQNYGGYF